MQAEPILCKNCNKNDVPHVKYLCLECICVAPDCVKCVEPGQQLCNEHICTMCSKEKGELYFTSAGQAHYFNENANITKQESIDFSMCPQTRQKRNPCPFLVHSEICLIYEKINFQLGSDTVAECHKLSKCQHTYENGDICYDRIVCDKLMRCTEHINVCNACYTKYIGKSDYCNNCTMLGVFKCPECYNYSKSNYNCYLPYFRGSEGRCLFHQYRRTTNTMYPKIFVNYINMVDQINIEIVDILKYYYYFYKTHTNKSIPADYYDLFKLPRDIFFNIMQMIADSPSIITIDQYIANRPTAIHELTIKFFSYFIFLILFFLFYFSYFIFLILFFLFYFVDKK